MKPTDAYARHEDGSDQAGKDRAAGKREGAGPVEQDRQKNP